MPWGCSIIAVFGSLRLHVIILNSDNVGRLTPVADGLALVFDLDGVVIDSMPIHLAAWKRYLESIGIEIAEIDARMHGRRNDDIVAEFISRKLSPSEVFAH